MGKEIGRPIETGIGILGTETLETGNPGIERRGTEMTSLQRIEMKSLRSLGNDLLGIGNTVTAALTMIKTGKGAILGMAMAGEANTERKVGAAIGQEKETGTEIGTGRSAIVTGTGTKIGHT